MRTIYSIDEATELTQRTKDDLIALGCSGSIQFLFYVPNAVKIGNVGWLNTEEENDPVQRTLNRQAFHLAPISAPKLDLLALSEEDCRKLQTRGTLRQTVFFRAAVFRPDSEIEIIRPSRPNDDPYGLGKLYSPIRVFAAYDRSTVFQELRSNTVAPTKEVLITSSQLHIAAAGLLPYLASQEQKASVPPLLSSKSNTAVTGGQKRARSTDAVSLIIKKLYLAATEDEKATNRALWEKFKALARQKPSPSPLLDEVPNGILYEKSLGEERILTEKQFRERLDRMRNNMRKN